MKSSGVVYALIGNKLYYLDKESWVLVSGYDNLQTLDATNDYVIIGTNKEINILSNNVDIYKEKQNGNVNFNIYHKENNDFYLITDNNVVNEYISKGGGLWENKSNSIDENISYIKYINDKTYLCTIPILVWTSSK